MGEGDRIAIPSVVDVVVDELRALILAGTFGPGERLIEERICERFGISRPPLREALRVLQREGLVSSRPRRGYSVISLSDDDVREIYSLRGALERLAAELAVPVADENALSPLEEAIGAMRTAASDGDDSAMLAANVAFHSAFVALADHSRLQQSYELLRSQLQLCMAQNLRFRQHRTGDPWDVVRRHESLLERVRGGDVQEVVAELAEHGDRSFLRQEQ
ncbi:DNA-binding GntR family transcriptional regulator [Saccharopolyspora lacisalsi]|uniref:DNA-binding GntR family transcriptional regulator n=1 Tax=Halosaccharopolyspora lacisalsi TaxID=1000566 RepID=A0A839DVB3_9PSEU|nr:GntR family transcriptional regulator [Halosaccharopolyspora lacisalsi]MBA8824196.1 DNA-binding GntR family transcriptional regulator [Halosaccharopolyspora lacisalsi]